MRERNLCTNSVIHNKFTSFESQQTHASFLKKNIGKTQDQQEFSNKDFKNPTTAFQRDKKPCRRSSFQSTIKQLKG
jgi:hypothetical protein